MIEVKKLNKYKNDWEDNMKFTNTIKFKLILALLSIAAIPLFIMSIYQLIQIDKTATNNIKAQVTEMAGTTTSTLDWWLSSKVSQLTNTVEANPEFLQMELDEINEILSHVRNSDSELAAVVALNKQGSGISASSPNGYMDLSEREYYQKVKETKDVFITDILESRSTGNKVITIAAPILDNSKNFEGLIFSQLQIDVLEDLLENIKVAETGYAFLLASDGEFISHPVEEWLGMNYKEVVTHEATKKVFDEEILAKESGFIRYKDHEGNEKVGAYCTVAAKGWKVVVTVPASEVYEEVNKTKLVVGILIAIAFICIIIVAIFIADYISAPIKFAANQLNVLANADFTIKASNKSFKRKDEIGILTKAMGVMIESVRTVLQGVVSETKDVKENIKVSSQNLVELNLNIEEISATTQEMSAGMQETAAASEEMNATAVEIERAVESIAEKTQNGAVMAQEISKRALDLKENAVLSQQSAYEIHQAIDANMRTSIEEVKAVEKINVLTESILQITAQTNLLALNAAIEAARAGEVGRGFAVVADEIRKLAEDSKKAVSEIQDVTKLVVTSVQSLAQSSEKALDFIDTTVINDYKTLVNTGEQYYKDSEVVQDLVTDLSATSEELLASIESMTKTINEVAVSNTEGSKRTQNIAEKASDIMEKTANVTALIKKTEENSDRLVKAVSRFKI
jgi:methyl-accepting chemotaxis protein